MWENTYQNVYSLCWDHRSTIICFICISYLFSSAVTIFSMKWFVNYKYKRQENTGFTLQIYYNFTVYKFFTLNIFFILFTEYKDKKRQEK